MHHGLMLRPARSLHLLDIRLKIKKNSSQFIRQGDFLYDVSLDPFHYLLFEIPDFATKNDQKTHPKTESFSLMNSIIIPEM